MNRNWHRRAAGGLSMLSAALLSAVGLLWDGASSGAIAQTYSGASSNVTVNYDALNALPGQPAQSGAQGGYAGAPPQSQFVPGYPAPGTYAAVSPYAPYGAMPPRMPYAAPYPPAYPPVFAAPPPGAPASTLTTIGPDGRPIAPIQLRQPGSEPQGADSRMAAVTPPSEPVEMPESVPMPEPTPPAPAPGVNAGQPPAVPEAEVPEPPEAAEIAEPETPAPEEAAPEPTEAAEEQPAEEQPTEQAAQEPPAETAEGTAEGEAPAEAEEEPTEEAAVEAPAEPDNSQPAPPIPQGGIRIVFPIDLNDVPVEANAALDDLAAQMQADEEMRIQIKCYASGDAETESKARRKSLQRCINIRQYLFKKDVRTTRMDVRALGLKSEGQPADRVDIVPANS